LGLSGGQGKLIVVFYDPVANVLIYMLPESWIDMRTWRFSLGGLLLIWLVLHHTLFLKPLTGEEPPSGLLDRLSRDGVLNRYRELKRLNRESWHPVEFHYSAPSRRKRTRPEEEPDP
jgi:hypothetical protein